jgi:GT2 family glycosyltransferase
VLFAYNRPTHLERSIESVSRNPLAGRTSVIAFSDGPATDQDVSRVEQVRRVLKAIRGFASVEIVERPRNLGLAASVIAGVTEIIEAHGRAIVLEDDLVVSPHFLGFMNDLLRAYEADERVFSVTGYNYPARVLSIPSGYPHSIYFGLRASSWGWGTWKDRWSQVDWDVGDFEQFMGDRRSRRRFDRGGDDLSEMLGHQMAGRLDSWAIRWCYAAFRLGRLNAYPVKSLVTNIGLDDSGIHCGPDDRLVGEIDTSFPGELHLPSDVAIDPKILANVRLIFARDLLSRARRKLRAMLARKER